MSSLFNKRKLSDKELVKICTQFRYGVIGRKPSKGKCYMITAPLQSYLYFLKIESKLIEGFVTIGENITNHYWMELPDNRILDATADQFNEFKNIEMPKVYLGEKPEWYMNKKQKIKK